MKKTLLVLLFALTLCVFSYGAGPIIVAKNVRDNPTIELGRGGDAALDNEVRAFLAVCGWFDLVETQGDYRLQLQPKPGGGVRCDLTFSGAPLDSWGLAVSDRRAAAKAIVDHAIETSFSDLKVKGFCASRIAFCARTAPDVRNVYACDIDGKNVVQLTHYNALCVEPCWTPGARSICYSRYGRSGIDIIETTLGGASKSRILSSFRGINTGAAVSPDGRSIAVILSFDHKVDLYIMTIGTGKLTRLTKGIAVEASPCWSPDGSRLAYVSDESGVPRIIVCNRDGSGKRRLPTIGADAVTPDWSADDQIVYATRVGGGYTLAVFDLKTNQNRRITEDGGGFESPAWAADNRQVVCKRSAGRKSDLAVVDSRTGKVRTLLRTGYDLAMPAWSPCAAKSGAK
ncbi:MAG: hypothetical protein MJ016_05370 [Victivallaceae bacterium]|nr:hypothetical protein [Victivallaceae bacterium]